MMRVFQKVLLVVFACCLGKVGTAQVLSLFNYYELPYSVYGGPAIHKGNTYPYSYLYKTTAPILVDLDDKAVLVGGQRYKLADVKWQPTDSTYTLTCQPDSRWRLQMFYVKLNGEKKLANVKYQSQLKSDNKRDTTCTLYTNNLRDIHVTEGIAFVYTQKFAPGTPYMDLKQRAMAVSGWNIEKLRGVLEIDGNNIKWKQDDGKGLLQNLTLKITDTKTITTSRFNCILYSAEVVDNGEKRYFEIAAGNSPVFSAAINSARAVVISELRKDTTPIVTWIMD